MQEILFDSMCSLDKLPVGAVAVGTKIILGLRVNEALAPTDLHLAICSDGAADFEKRPMEAVWSQGGFVRFQTELILPQAGLYWYYFELADKSGQKRQIRRTDSGSAFSENTRALWQLTVFESDYTTPRWICGEAFYHIFVDRFFMAGNRRTRPGTIARNDWGGMPEYRPDSNGEILNNDFFGGNLQGVLEKLPYLSELGIGCIYLSPIFEAYSNHKYDTGNYMSIDPAFGDDDVFAKLCYKAKELGIRIILDGVFNHTGADSVYFNKYGHYSSTGAYNNQSSPYSSWYSFSHFPNQYAAWWGIKTLPQVNEDEPSYREFILGQQGVIQKWMSLGAGGWRLDVADELTEDFISSLRQTVKSIDPDALVLGEVWEDASNKIAYGSRRHYFLGSELDGVMNYPFRTAIINYIMSTDSQPMSACVESICENYPQPALDCMMNILGTHDTPRILTVLSGAQCGTRDEKAAFSLDSSSYETARSRLYLASLLQFTLPGVPSIYYGDEAGMEGFEDPFNRRCFPWGSEDALITRWYSRLIKIRKSCPCFAGGSYETLTAKDGVFSFSRKTEGSQAVIITNCGIVPFEAETDGGSPLLEYLCSTKDGSFTVLPGGCTVIVTETPEI